jgi:hypothetical protein
MTKMGIDRIFYQVINNRKTDQTKHKNCKNIGAINE